MCGFAGVLGSMQNVQAGLVREMADAIINKLKKS
jgi:hypothetical protein